MPWRAALGTINMGWEWRVFFRVGATTEGDTSCAGKGAAADESKASGAGGEAATSDTSAPSAPDRLDAAIAAWQSDDAKWSKPREDVYFVYHDGAGIKLRGRKKLEVKVRARASLDCFAALTCDGNGRAAPQYRKDVRPLALPGLPKCGNVEKWEKSLVKSTPSKFVDDARRYAHRTDRGQAKEFIDSKLSHPVKVKAGLSCRPRALCRR